jgi:hypothetical protein
VRPESIQDVRGISNRPETRVSAQRHRDVTVECACVVDYRDGHALGMTRLTGVVDFPELNDVAVLEFGARLCDMRAVVTPGKPSFAIAAE